MSNRPLKCLVNRDHKVKALYTSPNSKGWTKVDNHYYCHDCEKAFKLTWEEI